MQQGREQGAGGLAAAVFPGHGGGAPQAGRGPRVAAGAEGGEARPHAAGAGGGGGTWGPEVGSGGGVEGTGKRVCVNDVVAKPVVVVGILIVGYKPHIH